MLNHDTPPLTRRQLLQAAAGLCTGLAGLAASRRASAGPDLCREDLAISSTTALVFPAQAPLVPAPGLRDARAVWSRVPPRPDRGVLIYLHGHNNFVTVDAAGRSRVPDWAAADAAARAGATSKLAAPLLYGLDRLDAPGIGRKPVVLVPEAATLAAGAFWAKEPAGQYADPARLGALVGDCFAHLACLHRPDGHPYLSGDFVRRISPSGQGLERVYLAGHSGAGLPLEEAAGSALLRPETGVPADLWLFDCTYWGKVTGFVRFCDRWRAANRLGGGHRSARFVCVYRPQTQTEAVADALRLEIASLLGVPAESLVKDHTDSNFETTVQPALREAGVLFLRTILPHDSIPTFFTPALLQTAAL